MQSDKGLVLTPDANQWLLATHPSLHSQFSHLLLLSFIHVFRKLNQISLENYPTHIHIIRERERLLNFNKMAKYTSIVKTS